MRGQSHDMVQLLTPEGQRVANENFEFTGTTDDLVGYLKDMILARRFDAEATALQRQGELGLWPSLLGQEAAQVGSAHAVREADVVFPSYREHAVAMVLGVPLTNLLGLFRGVDGGDWQNPNEFKNFHLYTIVIGSQALHATGYAMGVQRDGAVGNGNRTDDNCGRSSSTIEAFTYRMGAHTTSDDPTKYRISRP